MPPRTIEAFKLRTELIVDATKHHSEYQKAEKDVTNYEQRVVKAGKETAKAFDGASTGKKFGADFGASAVASITGSIGALGQTIGALVGSAVAPGIGTAIGSTIGSGIDTALQKVSGPILEQISRGIELNKLLERSKVHFTTFVGNEKEAVAHLEELKKLSGDTGLRMGVLIEGSQRLEEFTSKLDQTRLFMRAAADQSAKFYGDATVGFDGMADALGRIMLRGEDVGKLMKKLEGQGVHWKQYLAEGLGISEKRAAALIKAGRIKGEGISTMVAQGIERHAGGFAQTLGTVGPGVEQRADALMEIRSAEGTQKLTGGITDAYTKFVQILDSPQAKKVVDFIDKMGGYVVNLTESAVTKAVSVGGGIAEGIMNFNPASMMQSFTKLGGFVESGLKTVFEIHSPSELSAREIGEPIGVGIGLGVVRGLRGFVQGDGGNQIVATIRDLAKDPRIDALLNTIAKSEGGGMNVMAGGRRVNSGALHPGQVIPKSQWFKGNRGPSSAAGLYQETLTNWLKAESVFGPLNFSSPDDQKLVALWLMVSHPGGTAALQSGDISQMKALVAKDWTSTPGSRIGGGSQVSQQKWMGTYQSFLGGGKPIDSSNPMPVRVVADIEGGASQLNRDYKPAGDGTRATRYAGFPLVQNQKDLTLTADSADKAVKVLRDDVDHWAMAAVNVTDASKELITTTSLSAAEIGSMSIAMKPLRDLIPETTASIRDQYKATAELQKANWQYVTGTLSLGQKLLGGIQQISGMIPSQQVGKKRSLFSKILGAAAPFLSFIPGVGPILSPILSTIAGAASSIVGGNYGAGISTIAGGFQTGGVFRSSGGGSAAGADHSHAAGLPFVPYNNYRANLHYGERVLTARENQNLGGGGGLHPEVAAMFERLHATLDRLQSARPGDVFMAGAHRLPEALSRDASTTRKLQLGLGLS